MSEYITTLTDGTFDEEVKGSDVPVLVDFWATWCGPCRAVAPILEEIAKEQQGSLRIGKVDVDSNSDLAMRFEIQSIPTMILFKDGEPTPLRMIGAKSKDQLLAEVAPYLA